MRRFGPFWLAVLSKTFAIGSSTFPRSRLLARNNFPVACPSPYAPRS